MEQQNAGSPADVAPDVHCTDNDGMPKKTIKYDMIYLTAIG
jgi:hypothetical protein